MLSIKIFKGYRIIERKSRMFMDKEKGRTIIEFWSGCFFYRNTKIEVFEKGATVRGGRKVHIFAPCICLTLDNPARMLVSLIHEVGHYFIFLLGFKYHKLHKKYDRLWKRIFYHWYYYDTINKKGTSKKPVKVFLKKKNKLTGGGATNLIKEA